MNSIKKHREENNLTQTELAKRLGLSQRMIAYYESGASIPTGRTLIKLSKLFGITTDELLSDYTPNTPTRSDKTTNNTDAMKSPPFEMKNR